MSLIEVPLTLSVERDFIVWSIGNRLANDVLQLNAADRRGTPAGICACRQGQGIGRVLEALAVGARHRRRYVGIVEAECEISDGLPERLHLHAVVMNQRNIIYLRGDNPGRAGHPEWLLVVIIEIVERGQIYLERGG